MSKTTMAPQPATLADLWRVHAEERPNAPAILAPGRPALSFAALEQQVAETRAALQELGLGPGDRVAVAAGNYGAEAAVAELAVASAATCALVDAGATAAELLQHLDQVRPKALVIHAGADTTVRDVAARRDIPVVTLTPVTDGAAGTFTLSGPGNGISRATRESQPGDIAVVATTTGTTARPKLIPLTHAKLAQVIEARLEVEPYTYADRLLVLVPLRTASGFFFVSYGLAAGAAVVLPPAVDPGRLLEWIADLEVTAYTAYEAVQELVIGAAKNNPELAQRSKLRRVVANTTAVAEGLRAGFGADVRSAYFMSEALNITFGPEGIAQSKPGSVGVPVAGTDVRIRHPQRFRDGGRGNWRDLGPGGQRVRRLPR